MENLKYYLVEPFSNGSKLEIDGGLYRSLLSCHNLITSLLEIEELFSIVVKSFFQFEKLLLEKALVEEFFGEAHDASIMTVHQRYDDIRREFNVCILTILTAIRSYHDQRPSLLKRSGLVNCIHQRIKNSFSEAYDSSFDYRLMVQLRNYAQHNKLPIVSVQVADQEEYSDCASLGRPSRGRITIDPMMSRQAIVEHEKSLKTEVMTELRAIPEERLNAKALLRNHLSALTKCHISLRGMTEEVFQEAQSSFTQAKELFISSHETPDGCKGNHLHLVHSAEVGRGAYLDLVLIEKLKAARARWSRMVNFRRSYISSELVAASDTFYGNVEDIWIPCRRDRP